MPRRAASTPAPRLRARVLAALRRNGLLFESDAEAPSVASIVAGAPIAGSWWGHPAGRAIFATCEWLHDHADVACAKLVRGKRTYVARPLWPALLAVATAREPWQTRGLSPRARRLAAEIERMGTVRLDEVAGRGGARGNRAAALELERRLLLQVESVHTERGAHELVLASWRGLEGRLRIAKRRWEPASARVELERAAAALLGRAPTRGDLPWIDGKRARRSP